MKLQFFFYSLAIGWSVTIGATGLWACQCSGIRNGNNSWEAAQKEVEGASAIFEGVPERIELQWSVVRAKEGELVPAWRVYAGPMDPDPRMLITFRTLRTYKGDLGREVQIKTGLGGGDCGAVYTPGLSYLVFAAETKGGGLGVSMCSPGGWIGGVRTATELRYLRFEEPTARDLATFRRWNEEGYAAQEAQEKVEYQEAAKTYDRLSGKICGAVLGDWQQGEATGEVSFFSAAGYSPADFPSVPVNSDGSFCSRGLGPGQYYVDFRSARQGTVVSVGFYPGVSDREQAKAIDVRAGETQTGILWKALRMETHSVFGILSTDGPKELASPVEVALLSLDRGLARPWYDATAHEFLSNRQYFHIENVPPGRYLVVVSVMGEGWHTRKRVVEVTNQAELLFLEFVHRLEAPH